METSQCREGDSDLAKNCISKQIGTCLYEYQGVDELRLCGGLLVFVALGSNTLSQKKACKSSTVCGIK